MGFNDSTYTQDTLKIPSSAKCVPPRWARRSTSRSSDARGPLTSRKVMRPACVVSLDPQTKADAPLLTTNTEMHIAPKLRNSTSSTFIAKTPNLQPQNTCSGSHPTCPSMHPRTRRIEDYARAPRLLARRRRGEHRVHPPGAVRGLTSKATFQTLISFTSFDNPAPSGGRCTREGAHFHRATLHLLGSPLDPSHGPSGKASNTKVLAGRYTAAASTSASDDEEDSGEKGEEVLSGCRVGTPAGRDILLFAPDGKAGEWDLSLTHVAATNEGEPASKVISGADVARSLPSTLVRHDETPVPTLKGIFKHWWGNAAWHCSSVIAFDKVDKVPGVELEVCFFILPLYVLSLPR
ncbi:hypothetical protein FIBSPDRAFT_960008 [Athelia psychrophila]|uniref:Uncharacterized protein n=1 Tax=Athelia psychrophila TaxID=1759441 RepID=A0A166CWB3_9AGAM|nr:hypothetical protein FIBSPDRAFT_960008 [Fibularhizoctonia sp. CBS 109695]